MRNHVRRRDVVPDLEQREGSSGREPEVLATDSTGSHMRAVGKDPEAPVLVPAALDTGW